MYKSFIYSNDRLGINLNALLDEEGEIWFIGKEVAEVLGIKDTRQALRNQVLEEDKLFLAGEEYKKFVGGIQHPPQNNKVRNITLITESGLYDLVLSSKKKEAKDFRRWVTKEVLPSIRKNGYYIDNNNITQEQLDKLQKEKDELEIKLKEANELIDNELNADYFYTIREVREIFGLWEDEFSTDRLKEVSEKLNHHIRQLKGEYHGRLRWYNKYHYLVWFEAYPYLKDMCELPEE